MSRTQSQSKGREGLQLFSELMLMKFKPKSQDGIKRAKTAASIRKSILGHGSVKQSAEQQEKILTAKLNHIIYLELASKDTVILGNYNQLDMIDLDGLTNGFVDTYHYWSFCPGIPIMNFKVNAKKQVMLVHSLNNIMLYTYQTIKMEASSQPEFVASIQIKDEVRYIQFPSSDLIALFYEKYFEIYSLSDSYVIQKKLEKKYNIEGSNFRIFSVPQGVDNTVNIFFEQTMQKTKVFGLWCIEVNLFSQTIRQNQPYKIYDIQKSLKDQMLLNNYSKQVIVLNLGQEILIASRGYIVDSVNINLQLGNAYLKLIPHKHTLLHIQTNFMEVYQFTINTSVFPHRIQLSSLDSIEISSVDQASRLINVVPVFDHNYALFYEVDSPRTTNGQIFYEFMMSYTVKLSEKINRILNLQIPLSQMSDERIDRKCDVLRKIGLKDEQIYQQLWKRSSQTSVKDYQFLLSTRSYKIIKGEVQRKMRKTAIRFKQLIKIEESCLDILRSKISNQECSIEDLKDYLMSHLLLRKLKLFKQIELIRNKDLIEGERVFNMNIQQYYTFKNFKMQNVVEKIGQYLNTGQGSLQQIRTILYHFRFAYRHIYYQLLEDIIKEVKSDLKRLLIQLPELLPLNLGQEKERDALREGVWGDISQLEWEESLYFEKVACLNNKELLDELTKSVWFKRNWLIMHDMIPLSRNQILQKTKNNEAPQIFYFFIDKAFKNIKDEDTLRDLLRYIQSHYNKFPNHIRKKVILYSKLYQFLHQHDSIREHRMNFEHFLTLNDPALFQIFFELEKVRKGCLLRDIRQIYLIYADSRGQQFNECLLSYFKSDISEISHLKYLLNRINNEKKQFHSSHQSMYAVLVRAMQIKLRIGGPQDIPIDQVLIYLENIPISSPNSREIIKDLEMIQKISEEYDTLKKMKIDMTIREIIDNYETVMEKIVDYEIIKFDLLEQTNQKAFISIIYRILAEIQSFKKNIYEDIDNELAFFILLTKLMEKQDKISLVKLLLHDEYINNYYLIDISTLENLVKYMYRWKFSENNSFLNNEAYINNLLQLLPSGNNFKAYIQEQVVFAKLLSIPREPIRYPLSIYTPYPRLEELEQVIKNFDKEALLSVNIEQVIQNMLRIRELSEILDFQIRPSNYQPNFSTVGGYNPSVNININGGSLSNYDPHSLSTYDPKNSMMRSMMKRGDLKEEEIYEVFIKTYISKGLIREALPYIKKSVELSEEYDVLTIIILLHRLFDQLNDETKVSLINLVSLLYNEPSKLLTIVEKLVIKQMTSLQIAEYIQKQYFQVKKLHLKKYNSDNLIFNIHFRYSEDESQTVNKNELVKKTLFKLKRRRPEFRNDFMFDFLYVLLCHKPLNISVFLKHIGVYKSKLVRSFFSHLITEEIFDQLHVLEAMKRVYYFLLKSFRSQRSIDSIIKKYSGVSLVEDLQIKEMKQLNEVEKKVWNSVKAFERKKKNILEANQSGKLQEFLGIDKQKSIRESLQNIEAPLNASRQEYVFSDSDDDYQTTEKEVTQPNNQTKNNNSKHQKIKFNKMKERLEFCKKSPIKSREQSQQQKPMVDSSPIIQINLPTLSPLDVKKPSKYKKYFSQDVRSHFDDSSQFKDSSFDRQSAGSCKRKGSVENIFTQPIIQLDDGDHNIQKSGIKRIGSDKLRAMRGTSSFDLDINIPTRNSLDSEDLLVENKLSNMEYPETLSPTLPKLKAMKMESINQQTQMSEYAKQILEKIYKSYRAQLENEPYSLKALMAERSQNQDQFTRMLPMALQEIYENPDRDLQTALRLLLQIAEKLPESNLNKIYTDIYHKIAKLESKYGLGIQMQKMLPLGSLFEASTSIDELFENVKPSIIALCSFDNIQKIGKLISIGFKRSALEESVLENFMKKEVESLNRQKQQEKIASVLQNVKDLNAKLNAKMLIELADPVIKKATSTDLRKKFVKAFAESIRLKGKGREASELTYRFK